jgi:DNA-directed RNA polymerase subunit alpha
MLIIQRPSIEALGEELNNRQSFGIGPLDPGFGHTLGNSLRRTLLSSIPGAAATRVKFDAVLHEFGVIEGVKEDVQDICLNLKDLLLIVHSDEPVTLRLDKRTEGPVTAADLSTTADVEILNPDLHLAYLTNPRSALSLELTVERGKGYVGAEGNKGSSTIGVIPLDAIFTPVRRVSFEIEPVRVEQSKDFDRLVIDIETDGSARGPGLGRQDPRLARRSDRELRRGGSGAGVGRRGFRAGRGQ